MSESPQGYADRMNPEDGHTDGAEVGAALIVDVDGTLVDSTYEHVLAWVRAFRTHEIDVPAWRIHRAIGMGGDQLVPHLAGPDVDARLGDRIRDTEAAAYQDYLPHVRPFSDAVPFLEAARALNIEVVLASSSKPAELDRYLELLEVERLGVRWTTTDDVSNTKPAPDIIESALAVVDVTDAVMVGDATWDVRAAERAGIETIAMLTGGYGEDELLAAGAVAVYARLEELTAALPSWFDRAASLSRLSARNPT